MSEWVEQGRWLGAIGRGSGWWIGDWVRYGSVRYGDKYAAAAQVTGYDVQSLMNMSYVASRFDASRRRRRPLVQPPRRAGRPAAGGPGAVARPRRGRPLSVRALRAELRNARQRSASRAAMARARLQAAPDPAPAEAGDVLECPHCGHHFPR